MRFLKQMYDWLFEPTYKVFQVERKTNLGTPYWGTCGHSRIEWWYWQGIFSIMKILEIPSELNKRLQKQLEEIRNKEI